MIKKHVVSVLQTKDSRLVFIVIVFLQRTAVVNTDLQEPL